MVRRTARSCARTRSDVCSTVPVWRLGARLRLQSWAVLEVRSRVGRSGSVRHVGMSHWARAGAACMRTPMVRDI